MLAISSGRMRSSRPKAPWSVQRRNMLPPGELCTPDTISTRTNSRALIVQELCESRGGRPGLSVLTSLLVSMDVKIY